MFIRIKEGDFVLIKDTKQVGWVMLIDEDDNKALVETELDNGDIEVNSIPLASLVKIDKNKNKKKEGNAEGNSANLGKSNMSPYEMVKEMHETFNHPVEDRPTLMSFDVAYNRSKWVLEELIEHLAATDAEQLLEVRKELHETLDKMIDTETEKIENNVNGYVAKLMSQVDALVDQLYFVYGSFVTQGVDPTKPFEIVHKYNMDKLDNGKIVYKDEGRTKIGKREGWIPPDKELKEEIRRQQNK